MTPAALDRRPPLALLRRELLLARQRENLDLNSKEFAERRLILSSSPRRIFLQINAVCNADCVFCSKGYDYPTFGLDDFRKAYGGSLAPVLARAEQLVLTGSGEFLGLPQAEKILEYFNSRFPHVDKFIATNASHKPRIWELIADAQSRYTLQVSLHSTDAESHRQMMRYGAWEKVQENLRYLVRRREEGKGPGLQLMFIMTTLNAERLPDFIRMAAELKADRVVAGYFYIYESNQKYLSLFFKQDLANRAVAEARRVAEELGVKAQLPPLFGEPPPGYETPACCPEPWHQIMLNPDGHVLPCDVYGRFDEDLTRKSFWEIWNGKAYREIRRSLAKGEGCITTCPRQNVSAVNRWESHVIHRHKDPAQIIKEHQEALRKP